jgi:hypothetical protein
MKDKEWLLITFQGKSIDEEVNVYHRKAMSGIRLLFEVLLSPYETEICACNGFVKVIVSKDFKTIEAECNIICPELNDLIKEVIIRANFLPTVNQESDEDEL